jgi:hypothetical protein
MVAVNRNKEGLNRCQVLFGKSRRRILFILIYVDQSVEVKEHIRVVWYLRFIPYVDLSVLIFGENVL